MRKLGLFVLLSVLGCGGVEYDEVRGAVTAVNDTAFSGWEVTEGGHSYQNITADWLEGAPTGTSGDGFAQHVSIGQKDGQGSCFGRAGTLDVIGGGGTKSLFFQYSDSGTIVGTAQQNHQYKVVLWTVDAGAHMNVQITDLTIGQIVYAGSKAKPACTFFGHSVGWLVERPVWGGTRRALANFSNNGVTGTFNGAHYFDKFGTEMPPPPAVASNQVTMVGSSGNSLAVAFSWGVNGYQDFWLARN